MARARKTPGDKPEKTTAEKKEAPSSDRSTRLGGLVADLRSRYPDNVFTGEDYTMPWAVRRLPFGIPDLDIATNGGAPGGGMTMIIGKPGEGKNYLMNRLIRNQQKLYGKECCVAVIGTELAYDKTQGRLTGVRVALSNDEIDALNMRSQKLYKRDLTRDERAELKTQIGHFIIVPPSTAEKCFDIAVELVATGDMNLVGMDSFGAVLPEGDEQKDFADGSARVGGAAGLNTQLMRKLNNAFAPLKGGRPNVTSFIGINQVRDKMDAQKYEKKTQENGGWSLKHGRFLTIELARKEYIKNASGLKVAKTIGWEITKQKAGGWEGGVGKYDYVLAEGNIDMGELLLRLGVDHGVIDRSGNTYTYCGTTLGMKAATAEKAIVEHDLVDEIADLILEAAGVALLT